MPGITYQGQPPRGRFARWLSYVALALAGFFFISQWNFVTTAVRTDGKVVGMDRTHRTRSGWRYYPIFSFHDTNGAEHRIRSTLGGNPATHVIGDDVPVLYLPGHPEHACIDSFDSRWGFPLRLLALAVICRVIALIPPGRKRARWREQFI